jgi:putative spermidine/putrescine transport system ATP-binding protein
MGGQNVLAGKVTRVADGQVILASEQGDRFALPVGGRADLAGTLVHCAVRRDRIQVEKIAAAGRSGEVNALTGAVHAIEYQGSYVKVTLDVPGWPGFVANLPDDRFFASPVDIGDAVLARWSARDVRLLEADLGRAPEAAGEIGLYDQELGLAPA